MQIGAFDVTLLNDAVTYVDAGGAFGLVPRKLWARYFTPDADNNIPMCQTCLLVRGMGQTIVIDTGLGTKMDERQARMWGVQRETDLLGGLALAGVRAEDVSIVIDTHLHADHAGGNTRYAADGALVPTFPNARYFVQRVEYEDAMHPNERTRATYYPINYQPLVESGQMTLLDGDTEIVPGVMGIVTRGHTRAHMSVRISSAGQHLAFLCDLASYAVHFERLGWMTAYDVEPLQTLETKRIWQRWALETQAICVFPHDPFRIAGRLVAQGDGVQLVPLEVQHLNPTQVRPVR